MVRMKSQEYSFQYVGNNLAIDFINTEIVDRGEVIDLLKTTKDLIQWAHGAGISMEDNKIENLDLENVLSFRKALKELFVAGIDNKSIPRNALAKINEILLLFKDEQQLKNVKGKLVLNPAKENLSLEILLGRIAHDAALLLSSKQTEQIKKCSNPKCILMFLDTSRSRKRRWCSMEICGNRAKAANHYLNTKSD